jgi:hypothetical protein
VYIRRPQIASSGNSTKVIIVQCTNRSLHSIQAVKYLRIFFFVFVESLIFLPSFSQSSAGMSQEAQMGTWPLAFQKLQENHPDTRMFTQAQEIRIYHIPHHQAESAFKFFST